jgi:transposase-like protein
MCSAGGSPTGDLDFDDRVKAKKYRCNECGEKFESLSKKPICSSSQSDDVTAL